MEEVMKVDEDALSAVVQVPESTAVVEDQKCARRKSNSKYRDDYKPGKGMAKFSKISDGLGFKGPNTRPKAPEEPGYWDIPERDLTTLRPEHLVGKVEGWFYVFPVEKKRVRVPQNEDLGKKLCQRPDEVKWQEWKDRDLMD